MPMSWAYSASQQDGEESLRAVHTALDRGMTLLDTADMYGPFTNELLLGRVLRERRREAFVSTKCGLLVGDQHIVANGRPSYVKRACDASLRRLQSDVIDLYQLHRADPEVPVEETWGAMAELVTAGKVRSLGFCAVGARADRRSGAGIYSATIRQLERVQQVFPVSSVEAELSVWSREALDALVEVQLSHWRELLDEAVPVAAMVGAEYQPFLHTLLLGAQMHYDEVTLLRSRVLTEGVEPLSVDGGARRRPARPVPGPVPGHLAVIMDGNRRWAKVRGLPADQGHRAGMRTAMRLVNAAQRLGIRHVSIYMFSTENWGRSQEEVTALFDAFADWIARGAEWLHGLGVKVRWCGRRDRLDASLASSIALLESMTSHNDVLTLTMCVDYGGREELTAAARGLAAEAVAGTLRPEGIGPADLARHLYVPELPDVDLLIRTCEQRISNFLPWHLAYAELVFDPALWPDFDLARLRDAVDAYAGRGRRFGGNDSLPGQTGRAEPVRAG
ncbi:di-trans,poly-cis-decaprenylcistransferase [Streptomyces daliensis]|uniref:Isoprenyl transferase n=1 Tax=Streptomyces daliensis TaxID=299421 RepID=A0A8T4IQG3_9ACTN|nr:di-trans,poly-cis-decaprenylcistransferase [Streptomyces daliensis]